MNLIILSQNKAVIGKETIIASDYNDLLARIGYFMKNNFYWGFSQLMSLYNILPMKWRKGQEKIKYDLTVLMRPDGNRSKPTRI